MNGVSSVDPDEVFVELVEFDIGYLLKFFKLSTSVCISGLNGAS